MKWQRFVPFYVWLDQICKLVKLGVDEKKVQIEIDEVTDKIKAFQKEKEDEKLVLAYLNCDPDAGDQNQGMTENWEGGVEEVMAKLDNENSKLQSFDSQYIGMMNK